MNNTQVKLNVTVNLPKMKKSTEEEVINLLNVAFGNKEIVNIIEGRQKIELIMQETNNENTETKISVDMKDNYYYINGLTRFANDSYFDQKVFEILKKVVNTVKIHKIRILNEMIIDNQYNIK